jgi:hypothetical protein
MAWSKAAKSLTDNQCPLLALSGHPRAPNRCPLLGVKRTSQFDRACRQLSATPPLRSFHLVFEPHDGRALAPISAEKHEPVSDIDTAVVESLKALDPNRPIREADMAVSEVDVCF